MLIGYCRSRAFMKKIYEKPNEYRSTIKTTVFKLLAFKRILLVLNCRHCQQWYEISQMFAQILMTT